MSRLIGIAETSKLLGVSVRTLRTWDTSELIKPVRTIGGHRRYRIEDVVALQGINKEEICYDNKTAVYIRVSSYDQKQKGDLDRQKLRVLEYCANKGYAVMHIFEEISSGMNDNRPKLNKLFELATNNNINRLIIEHKDRLSRFNFKIFVKLFESHGVSVEWCEDVLPKTYEAELVEDMLSLLSSFSARIYGKRSADHRKTKCA